MKLFSQLYHRLDQTTKTNQKIHALRDYFNQASDRDKMWAIALFTHRRPRRTVTTTLLRSWAAETANIPPWLFEESYHVVGDLAETIALVLPENDSFSTKSLSGWIAEIINLRDAQELEKKTYIQKAWAGLNTTERFLFNKLITGGFRVGVSQKLVIKALSQALDLDENVIAHRLMGNWNPEKSEYSKMLVEPNPNDDISKPYPFFLAYALEGNIQELGDPGLWQAEHKWDGIRGQIIKRKEELFVWSRGEELVTDKYPEFDVLKTIDRDGFVIDGEILPFRDGKPLGFQQLQTRIGRKNLTRNILESAPVILMAYDLLEKENLDIRANQLFERRKMLEELIEDFQNQIHDIPIQLSPIAQFSHWKVLIEIRDKARENRTEGLMIKRKNSSYQSGRKKGYWWKWKIDPLTIDAVMLYATRGHGRRANLYTDFTFAVWDGNQLVPFAKAYSGLTDAEFLEITRFVQRNTLERYGPVRAVKPNLVFELAFEGINRSKRHKSGVALRFPRIKRWRKDKHPKDANTLEDLMFLLDQSG